METFLNREKELQDLNSLSGLSGLLVLIGRRRIGKTSLLTKWLEGKKYLYSQAIQGSLELQLDQLIGDFSASIELPSIPNSWTEFFRLLDFLPDRYIICLDEFPYLVKTDSSLPSIVQKWLDHKNAKNHLLVLSGSSTKMMSQVCLDNNSPLYGRAKSIIQLKPMHYSYFCEYLKISSSDASSFQLYSLTGGIPKYWENLKLVKLLSGKNKISPIDAAEYLYFGSSALQEGEIYRFLNDERIEGVSPISVLEAIARGASKPSEVASKLGVPQTQLYKVFQQLIAARLIEKEIPFGASTHTNKLVHLKIKDYSTLSWFRLASIHGSRWVNYSIKEKENLLNELSGQVFEDFVRESLPGALRFWNSKIEIDAVQELEKKIFVSEIKWQLLSKKDQGRLLWELEEKVRSLGHVFNAKNTVIQIFDKSYLESGSAIIYKEL